MIRISLVMLVFSGVGLQWKLENKDTLEYLIFSVGALLKYGGLYFLNQSCGNAIPICFWIIGWMILMLFATTLLIEVKEPMLTIYMLILVILGILIEPVITLGGKL